MTQSPIDWFVFGLFSATALLSAFRVVTSKEMTRSALALVVSLASLAPLFLLLRSEFAAVVQLLVYVGAVVVLFLFGVMLTRPLTQRSQALTSDGVSSRGKLIASAVVASVGFFGVIAVALVGSSSELATTTESTLEGLQLQDVGKVLLGHQLLAFELMSLLLLGALIGALTLARKR